MIPGAIILLYHRVTTLDRDPQLLCVSPANFESQIQWISDRYRVAPLAEIGRALAEGRPLENVVSITFDDGYADNLHQAAPILRQYDCPATVFATTAHTDSCDEFFWDDLDRIFLSPGKLPHKLEAQNIDLGESATYDGRHSNWNVLDESDPTPRHEVYRRLTSLLHQSTIAVRSELLNQLQTWAEAPRRQSHRMMSSDELRKLSNDDLVTIGGHTVDHCRLSAESLDVQQSQIQLNRRQLRSPAAFSYPFGTRHDYTADTVRLVQLAGYELACANFGGIVTTASDRYRLPRRIVRDWSLDQFAAEFDRWITPLRDPALTNQR